MTDGQLAVIKTPLARSSPLDHGNAAPPSSNNIFHRRSATTHAINIALYPPPWRPTRHTPAPFENLTSYPRCSFSYTDRRIRVYLPRLADLDDNYCSSSLQRRPLCSFRRRYVCTSYVQRGLLFSYAIISFATLFQIVPGHLESRGVGILMTVYTVRSS